MRQLLAIIFCCTSLLYGVVAFGDVRIKTPEFSAVLSELPGSWKERACGSDVCYVDEARQLTARFIVKKLAKNLDWREASRRNWEAARSRRTQLIAGRPTTVVTATEPIGTVKDDRQTVCFRATDTAVATRTFFCATGGTAGVIVWYELTGPQSLGADAFDDVGYTTLWSIAPGVRSR